MPDLELPRGRYLTLAAQVRPESGGQTRAMLLRNRIFAQEGGVRPEILALGPVPDHAERRRALVAQGALVESVVVRNLYEHYAEHGWGEEEPAGEPLADLAAHRVREESRADGTPWRIAYRPPEKRRPVYDYLRADGTPFLRVTAYALHLKRTWPRSITRIGPDGRPLGAFSGLREWHLRWLRDLTPEDARVFVFTDSRFLLPHLAPLRDKRMRLIYQMHNLHLQAPYRWDSPAEKEYERVLAKLGDVAALVTLTERQREDIGRRRGATGHMHVVPNPVVAPPVPRPLPARDPLRAAVVARLSSQKRLEHAVAAWEQVAAAVPGAHLDVYGDGRGRERLEAEVARRGLQEAVTLRGFDPAARDALWSASAFLLTSRYEGYPLATLESMARGCPVVAYDIRYGAREQIADGTDGFVVPAGDVDALAARVIDLLRSPDLVARMGAAARARAVGHDTGRFLAQWAEVVDAAARLRRPRVDGVDLELPVCRLVRTGAVARLAGRGPRVELDGSVAVRHRNRAGALAQARLELAWIRDGEVTEVPLEVEQRAGALGFAGLVALPPGGAGALRLRLLWRSFAWERVLARAAGDPVSLTPA